LGDLVVVDNNVDLAVMKALDLAADEVEPGWKGGRWMGGGRHGFNSLNLDRDILY
jgi:hypothetical protein